jgi:hypothetical protein
MTADYVLLTYELRHAIRGKRSGIGRVGCNEACYDQGVGRVGLLERYK